MPQAVIEGEVNFMRFKKGAGGLVVGHWSLVIEKGSEASRCEQPQITFQTSPK